MGFSRKEYWSGLPFPSPEGFFLTQKLNPGLLQAVSYIAVRFFTNWASWDSQRHFHIQSEPPASARVQNERGEVWKLLLAWLPPWPLSPGQTTDFQDLKVKWRHFWVCVLRLYILYTLHVYILYSRKLRHRVVKQLVQGHTASGLAQGLAIPSYISEVLPDQEDSHGQEALELDTPGPVSS